jgi:hypothetical protein
LFFIKIAESELIWGVSEEIYDIKGTEVLCFCNKYGLVVESSRMHRIEFQTQKFSLPLDKDGQAIPQSSRLSAHLSFTGSDPLAKADSTERAGAHFSAQPARKPFNACAGLRDVTWFKSTSCSHRV